jgi:hypothetical protein
MLCAACASASVRNVQRDNSISLQRPARIIVYDFDTGPTDVELIDSATSAGEPELTLTQQPTDVLADALADRLAASLVRNIQSLGLPAERAAGAAVPEVNDLVIEGDFVRVDPGSLTMRLVIGFGAGATDLRTQVRIFRVTEDGWTSVKQFETVASSSRMPGIAIGVGSGAAAGNMASAGASAGAGAFREFRSALDADAGRTAQQIAGRVSDLKSEQSW